VSVTHLQYHGIRVLTIGTEPKSRISEAFAAAIYDELVELDRVLSQLEKKYINSDMKSGNNSNNTTIIKNNNKSRTTIDIVISLLRLESILQEQFSIFHELDNILGNINIEGNSNIYIYICIATTISITMDRCCHLCDEYTRSALLQGRTSIIFGIY
jgi:hypothetical protein